MKDYPKVLLLGEPFNDYTGMGITLTNLFHDWPTESIAVASDRLDTELCNRIRPCCQYIKLGSTADGYKTRKSPQGIKGRIRNSLKYVYSKLGISDLRHIPITKSVVNCINTFRPDIIFNALGSIDRIRFCQEVKRFAPEAKLALYVVDDWPNTKFSGRFFQRIWKCKYDKAFRSIINQADMRLSICQAMSDAYYGQYGVTFQPFHNPVDVAKWSSIPKADKYPKGVVSILYVGKINRETRQSLFDMCAVVDRFNNNGQKATFDIFTPNSDRLEESKLYKGCSVHPQVSNEYIPLLLKSYTILFLTLGYSDASRKYARLSMPTKLTEYLVSEVPIVLYCPRELALSQYVTEHNVAVVCNEQGAHSLEKSVISLTTNTQLCAEVVANAKKLATAHDVHIVRERFRKTLAGLLNEKPYGSY